MFGSMFIKPHVAISAPPLSEERTTISEAELEHSKHAYNMDISAADPAAILVQSPQLSKEESQDFYAINARCSTPPTPQCETDIQEFAAIKIQKAFRGYLVS